VVLAGVAARIRKVEEDEGALAVGLAAHASVPVAARGPLTSAVSLVVR